MKGNIMLKKAMKAVSKTGSLVKKATQGALAGVKRARAASPSPPERPVSPPPLARTGGSRGPLAKVMGRVFSKRKAKIDPEAGTGVGDGGGGPGFAFKKGGSVNEDKVGRAMKKTDADAKGRAMSKAKGMMAGGMAKGYAGGGKVAAGKATRGYGAARRGS